MLFLLHKSLTRFLYLSGTHTLKLIEGILISDFAVKSSLQCLIIGKTLKRFADASNPENWLNLVHLQ